jgi:hypothetical protein
MFWLLRHTTFDHKRKAESWIQIMITSYYFESKALLFKNGRRFWTQMTIYKHALMRFGENILKRYPGHPICLRTDNFSLHGVYIAYPKSSSKCISVVLISLRLGFRRNFRSVSTSYSQRDYGGVTVCRNLFSQYGMKQTQALIPRALHTYRQVKHKGRLIVKSPVSDVCAILIYYRPNYSVV